MDNQNLKAYFKYLVIPAMFLLILLGATLSWQISWQEEDSYRIALNRAQAFCSIIQTHRTWNAEHGGVYVFITDKMQPNPYLEGSLRDVTTLSGLKLTKVNPAFMSRQVSGVAAKQGEVLFRITSLKPLRPSNKPDEWEASALRSFEDGNKERLELIESDEEQVYRYMAPLRVTESCLQCHAKQGYKLGDVRGGISVTFPAAPFIQSEKKHLSSMLIMQSGIFLAVLLIIIVYMSRLMRNEKELMSYRDHLEELVTKRTQALEVSEERYRRVVADSPIGITICDSTGQCIDVNDAMARIVGATREQILKQNYHEIQSWKESGLYEKALSAIKEKKTKRIDISLTTTFGKDLSMNCYLVPMPSDGLLFMAQDITDRMHAEKELKESEERFRGIFDNAQDGILLADLSERQFHVGNKSICSMLGYSIEEIKTLTVSDIHPSEELPGIIEKFEMMVQGKFKTARDIPVKRKDGSVFYCDITSSRVTLDGRKYLIDLFHDITIRKKTEDEIRRSEARLSKAQRIAHLGSWEWEISTNTLYWSDETYRIFGLRPGEFKATYEAFLKTIHPDDVGFVTDSVSKAVTEKKHHDITHRIILPDGTERIVHEQAEIIDSESGEPLRLTGTVHDITERKQAEEELNTYREHLEDLVNERTLALKENEERFRAIADYTYNWENWYGADGDLLWINPAVERHTGYSVDECLSMTDYPRPLIIDDNKAIVEESMINAIRDRSTNSDVEFSILHKDGSVRRMSAGWQPIYGNKGEYLGIRSSVRDITERKIVEDELRRSEERFRELFDHTPVAYQSLDESGRFIDVNDVWLGILGYEKDEVIGRSFGDFYDDETKKRFNNSFNKFKSDCFINNEELTLRKKGGEPMDVLITCRIQNDIDGKFLRIHCIIIDITDRKAAEEEIKEYARVQSVLLKEINHRVKNNLSAIMGMVNAEINDADEKESDVLNKLSNRIRGLSSVHNMLSRSEWSPILLSELCEEVLKGVLAGRPEGINTHYTVSPSEIRVESGQAHQLAMLVNELAINSLKHGLGDRDSLSVTLDIEKKGKDEVHIAYRDDGPGYPEAIIKGDYSAASMGFDVILNIAQKNLHGDIKLTNDGGATCMFSFTLLKDK